MSKIPKVGLHIIALLLLTVVGSFGARLTNYWRVSKQETIAIPSHIEVDDVRWLGSDVPAPAGDAERDHPPALNRVYQMGMHSPVFVSIARANTLNAFRTPASYLMDADGRLMEGEKQLIKPVGEKHTHYIMEIGQGHDSTILLIHWVQAPNQPAYADPNTIPTGVAKALLLHSTFYVCDVWVPLRADSNGAFIRKTLIRFANDIEAQIRTGHLAVETVPVIPSAADLNRLPGTTSPTLTAPGLSNTNPDTSLPGLPTPGTNSGFPGGGVITPPTDPGIPVPGGGL